LQKDHTQTRAVENFTIGVVFQMTYVHFKVAFLIIWEETPKNDLETIAVRQTSFSNGFPNLPTSVLQTTTKRLQTPLWRALKVRDRALTALQQSSSLLESSEMAKSRFDCTPTRIKSLPPCWRAVKVRNRLLTVLKQSSS